MTRTVTASCTITFHVGETFDPARSMTLAVAGEELIVVQEHSDRLTVRKNGEHTTFDVYTGQYQ